MKLWLQILGRIMAGLLWFSVMFGSIIWMTENEGTQWGGIIILLVWGILSLTTLIWSVEKK